jgi:hypothetical protein
MARLDNNDERALESDTICVAAVVDVVRVDSILVFKVNHNKIVKNHACLDDCLHHMTFSKTTSGGQDMELCLEHSKRSFNVLPLASCADANIFSSKSGVLQTF